jgi:hypothetical protein
LGTLAITAFRRSHCFSEDAVFEDEPGEKAATNEAIVVADERQ